MTSAEFLDEVAQPNMEHCLRHPGDVRALVNAALTLDALVGAIHAQGHVAGDPNITKYEADEHYRDHLAKGSRSYRVLRDLAASFKHGELKHAKARLVRSGGAVRSMAAGAGFLQAGVDPQGGSALVVELDGGPACVRASAVVGDSYRMLKRIVDGGVPQIDEGDRVTWAGH